MSHFHQSLKILCSEHVLLRTPDACGGAYNVTTGAPETTQLSGPLGS